MSHALARALEGVTRIPGVRSALVVSAEDGLVVAEAAMEGEDSAASAALGAALAVRLRAVLDAAGFGASGLLHLEADLGHLMLVPAGADLVVMSLADRDVNLGQLRLRLGDAARRVT